MFSGELDGDRITVATHRGFGEKVGSVSPAADGGLLVAGSSNVHVIDPAGEVTASIPVVPQGVASRLNDSTCDPRGRFLVGSVRLDGRTAQESLVSVDPDRSVRVVVDGITVSNGIGFAPDGATMYYVDSRPGVILAFDYDLETGIARARRVLSAPGGTPDGLAVDVEGNLWIAFFGDAQVRCLDPRGVLVDVVDVPVPNPTCPEFAGPDLDRLVVTSALFKLDAEQRMASPDSGALYLAEPGVRGLPPHPWAGSTTDPAG